MEHDTETEVGLRSSGLDGFRQGEITSWNRVTRVFTVTFPEDYLTYEGLKVFDGDEVVTMREANTRRLLKNLRTVAETGEFPNG